MPLLTHEWKPQDPTGAVSNYLRAMALSQEANEAQMKRQQQMLELVGRQILERKNHDRLAEADEARLAVQKQEQDRRYGLEKERVAIARQRASAVGRGTVVEPWSPLPVPAESSDAPALPVSDAAGETLPTGVGETLNRVANSTPQVSAFDEQPLELAGRSPFVDPALPRPDVMADVKDSPVVQELLSGQPGAPDISDVPGISAGAPSLEAGAKEGGTEFGYNPNVDPAELALIPGNWQEPELPGNGADAVLSPQATKRVNFAGKVGGAKAARAQAMTELKVQTKPQAYNGEAVTWVDDETAVTRGGRLLRRDEDGKLQPLTTKRVSGSYRGSDGNTYTQFSDGSWQENAEPPVGVTISKIGTTMPAPPMEEQIKQAGYHHVAKPGYENVVTNEDGTALFTVGQGANGRVTYKPFKSSGTIQTLKDGRVIRILPDGSTEDVANASVIPAKEKTDFTAALKREADATDAVARLETKLQAKGEHGLMNRAGVKPEDLEQARTELASARREVGVYQQRYPALSMPAKPASQQPGAPSPAQPSVYKDEAEARAAGRKSGEIITVINPKTGQPARARLE